MAFESFLIVLPCRFPHLHRYTNTVKRQDFFCYSSYTNNLGKIREQSSEHSQQFILGANGRTQNQPRKGLVLPPILRPNLHGPDHEPDGARWQEAGSGGN